MFKKMKNRKGFTLIEMMAVIAIVAVLVAIVVPTVGKAQMKSKGAVDAANLRSISASIATRYVTSDKAQDLKANIENPGSKVFPNQKTYIYVYREGSEINSYFAGNLLKEDNQLRGDTYNSYVATYGELPDTYDRPAEGAELLCIFGASDGSSIAEDIITELGANIGNIINDKYNELYPAIFDNLKYTIDENGNKVYTDTYQDALDLANGVYDAYSRLINRRGVDTMAAEYKKAYESSYYFGQGTQKVTYSSVETAYQDAVADANANNTVAPTRDQFAKEYFTKIQQSENKSEYAQDYADGLIGIGAATGALSGATDDVVKELDTSIDKIGDLAGTELDININDYIP